MASHNVDTSSARPKKGSCTDRSCVICRLLTYVWKYCDEPIMPRPSKMSWPNCPLPSTPIFSQEMSCPSKHYKNLITDFFVFGIFRLQCLQWIHQLINHPIYLISFGRFSKNLAKGAKCTNHHLLYSARISRPSTRNPSTWMPPETSAKPWRGETSRGASG